MGALPVALIQDQHIGEGQRKFMKRRFARPPVLQLGFPEIMPGGGGALITFAVQRLQKGEKVRIERPYPEFDT